MTGKGGGRIYRDDIEEDQEDRGLSLILLSELQRARGLGEEGFAGRRQHQSVGEGRIEEEFVNMLTLILILGLVAFRGNHW